MLAAHPRVIRAIRRHHLDLDVPQLTNLPETFS